MNVAREIRNVPISSKSRNVTKLSTAITSHMLDYANGREYSEQTAYRFRYALGFYYITLREKCQTIVYAAFRKNKYRLFAVAEQKQT